MKDKLKRRYLAIIAMMIIFIGQFATTIITNATGIRKNTSQGVVDFAQGQAKIKIVGNRNQTLKGKLFIVHRLFDAENSADLQSIQYSINDTYEHVLRSVVANQMEKTVHEVSEKDVINYMHGLNPDANDGAQSEQVLEGRYSEFRYFVEEVLDQIHSESISGMEIVVDDTKSDNSIEIKGLPFGYYMIEDATMTMGEYGSVSLTMVGTANPETNIQIKADYPVIVKKLQEDDKKEEIGLDGWNDIGDYEIGQTIPFKYESSIPDINGYDSYYYAWHDVMDEALSFQPDSVVVTISGTDNSYEKTYTLSETEYEILTNIENETFVIEVEDIKKIIDREFNQINENKENSYNQIVVVEYTATLNELAAADTGRPGFENDVRLEFSNNPNSGGDDETGYTPWDTVVCFTYKMNGVKVNTQGDSLEGAEFRLYYDPDCEQEVYVKQIDNGYCVINADSSKDYIEDSVAMKSNKTGMFVIYGLDSGLYYLKEEKAPAGYLPMKHAIKVNIAPVFSTERNAYVKGSGAREGVFSLLAQAYLKMASDGSYTNDYLALGTNSDHGSFNLAVMNETGKQLPITGSYVMPWLIGAGVVLMTVSIMRQRRKHE